MQNELVIHDVVCLAAPLRRKRYAAGSLKAVDRILEEIGAARDPVLSLASCLALETPISKPLRSDWASMVRAHAMDLYADAGMEALAWPQALAEAVYMLVVLQGNHIQSGWDVRVAGLALKVIPMSKRARGGNKNKTASVETRALTMHDVARELNARGAAQAWMDTEEVCDLLPNASLPLLAMATGALQALAVGGRLSGFERMTIGDGRLGWQARLHWPDTARGGGPTGENMHE